MFERLPGLLGDGPLPVQFSATGTGTHREGLVVRFTPYGTRWIGNFQRGLTEYDVLLPHPDREQVVVIAGGQGYVVNPETREASRIFGGAIVQAYTTDEPSLVIVDHQGISFEAIGPDGGDWHTPRLSWDGFRSVRFENGRMVGEAWSPVDDSWYRFEVDLATGATSGGSFRGA